MSDLENQLGMRAQQIVFWVWKPKKYRYTNPRVQHRWNWEYIPEDTQQLQRLSEFWLDKRANIFKDIRTKLGLYLPLYSSNREFLVSNRRETAKIVKNLEIFRVHIPIECWMEQDRSVVCLTGTTHGWDQCTG